MKLGFARAIRALVRQWPFTMLVVLTLAIGIVSSTVMLTVVKAVLWRPLPYSQPGQLFAVIADDSVAGIRTAEVASPLARAWSGADTIAQLASYTTGRAILALDSGELVDLPAAWLSPSLLSMLGGRVVIAGRSFSAEDARPGASSILISERLWRARFGGERALLGRSLRFQGRLYEVAGIVSGTFRFPDITAPDVFFARDVVTLPSAVTSFVRIIGRTAAHRSLDQVEQDLARLGTGPETDRWRRGSDTARHLRFRAVSLRSYLLGSSAGALLVGIAASACLLVLACGNVASLLLTRHLRRWREMAVRAALGATRRDLARAVVAENLIVALSGAGVALVAVFAAIDGVRLNLTSIVPFPDLIAVDVGVLLFAVGVALLTALICSAVVYYMLPAARLTASLAASVPTWRNHGARGRVTRAIVGGQTVLTVLLLLLGVASLATLWRLTGSDLGFQPSRLLTFKATRLAARRGAPADIRRALDEIVAMPDVISAGASTSLPLSGHGFSFAINGTGLSPVTGSALMTGVDLVSPGYFTHLGVPLIEGREFSSTDGPDAPMVAVVNQAFVRARVTSTPTVGQLISLGGKREAANTRIIGVVADVRDGNPGEAPKPTVYKAFAQAAPQISWHTLPITLRTDVTSGPVLDAVRASVSRWLPGATIYDVQTMEARIAGTVTSERQRAIVFGFFSIAAMVLTGVGIVGLVSYKLQRDIHDLSVRVAIGCPPTRAVGMVMWEGVAPVVIGSLVALVIAVVLAPTVQRVTDGIVRVDYSIALVAIASVAALAVLAAGVPARQLLSANLLVSIGRKISPD